MQSLWFWSGVLPEHWTLTDLKCVSAGRCEGSKHCLINGTTLCEITFLNRRHFYALWSVRLKSHTVCGLLNLRSTKLNLIILIHQNKVYMTVDLDALCFLFLTVQSSVCAARIWDGHLHSNAIHTKGKRSEGGALLRSRHDDLISVGM